MKADPVRAALGALDLDVHADASQPLAVLGAPAQPALLALPVGRVVFETGHRAHALSFEAAGHRCARRIEAASDALVIATPQRAETLGLVARAAACVGSGRLVVAAAKERGAGGLERALREAAGDKAVLATSKHHARVLVLEAERIPPATRDAWAAAAAVQPVLDGRFLSRPGLFSWDRADPGSLLLAEHLTAVDGRVADFGAGWGFLAGELLAKAKRLRSLDLFEIEFDALDCARRSLASHERAPALRFHWADVLAEAPPKAFDWIVTNPPFHAGGATSVALGRGFVAAAARSLRPGGSLLLVANRQLPYESVLRAEFRDATVLAERDGFKVLRAVR